MQTHPHLHAIRRAGEVQHLLGIGGRVALQVVLCGVADTGVLVYDPEPVGKGSSFWLTWKQLDTYIKGEPATAQFMTVI